MRILLLIDDVVADSKKQRVDLALEKIRSDYKAVTDVTWVYEKRDFSKLTWEYYLPECLGITRSIIQEDTKVIWGREPYQYDHVIYVVDPINWQDGKQGIGGWNLGRTYNKLYTQIVKLSNNDAWLYKIFAMEIAHAIDNLASEELNIDLDKLSGLDFDNDIIHGENPAWGVPTRSSRTGYFTNYEYAPVIERFGLYIMQAYQKRRSLFIDKLTQKLGLLQRLLELLKQLQALTKKPSPIFESELEEGEHYHDHNHTHMQYSFVKGLAKSFVPVLVGAGTLVAFAGFSDLTIWGLLETYVKPVLGSLSVGGVIALAANWLKFKSNV